MDPAPDVFQVNLEELGLPTTLADMKNPTEEYILSLITQFLTKFNVDVGTIKRPTFEQLTMSLAEDSPELISLINIYEAMNSICRQIFITDFHLTDVMCPVPKRTRKTAKFMVNFLLYVTNKMSEIEERLEEHRAEHKHILDLRSQRMAIIEAKKAQALRMAKKMEHKKQMETEIAELLKRKEERRLKLKEVEARLQAAEQEKMNVSQRHAKLNAQAIKMREKNEEIQSKIVLSPDRYYARLNDVLEQQKQQNEKRAVLQEALKTKKPAIEKTESCLTFVRQEHAKFNQIIESHKRFTESKKVLEQAEKKIVELKNLIELESMAKTEDGNQATSKAFEETKAACEEHLSSVRKEHEKLNNEKKILAKKLDDETARLQLIRIKRDEMRTKIIEKEADCKKYLKNCQELYDEEMRKEEESMRCVESALESLEGSLEKRD